MGASSRVAEGVSREGTRKEVNGALLRNSKVPEVHGGQEGR